MTTHNGISVDLEIFWSPSTIHTSPAIMIIPDLASASSGEHYVRVLLDTLVRRDLGNVCIVNTYRMTILPEDTVYLRACVGAFQSLLQVRETKELKKGKSDSAASMFMFDHTEAENEKEGTGKEKESAPVDTVEEWESQQRPIAAIAFSSGGVLMTKYLARYKGDEHISSAVTVSSFYDARSYIRKVEASTFFHPFMLWSNKKKR